MKKHPSALFILAEILALLLEPAQPSRGAGMEAPNLASPFSLYLPLIKTGPRPCSTPPTLVSPENGSNLDTLIPVFEWDSGTDPAATEFMLIVASDPGFTQEANSLGYGSGQGQGNIRFWRNFDPATTYYWHAWLTCGAGVQSPYSETWTFTSGSGGTILPAPELLAPANGTILAGIDTTFQWSSMPGAVEYQVQWRQSSGAGGYVAFTNGLQYGSYALSAGTSYEWWSAARNDYAWGTNSVHWSFTTGTTGP
jgi:hypothetical protein